MKAGPLIGAGWAIGAGLLALSVIVPGAMLGPGRAARIAGASFLSTTVDGLAEDPGPHRIPVIDLHVDPDDLDTLEADLPWSGGDNVKAVLIDDGVEHKVKFRYRGVVTPSHYLGGKKSFRLSMKRSNPFAPYRKLNVINPKAFNLVNDHMANWIAGEMGVPVPWNELVFVRMNGVEQGVMELFEQVDGTFERSRHLASGQVPVYKGDYPPIVHRKLTKGRSLWQNAAFWEYASKADSTVAHERLEALIAALSPDTLPVSAHRDSIAKLTDVEAFLRYEAALLVVNTTHIDQYHNQWLVLDPRTERFYPVFWDALMMFAPPGEPLYRMHDAMAWWLLHVPEWRARRDRYAYEAILKLHREGRFARQLDEVIERIQPSVLADRNKYGNVTLMHEDVHRVSLVHVVSSIAGLRASVAAYWEGLLDRFEKAEATVDRGTALRVRSGSEVPFRLAWTGDVQRVEVDGAFVDAELVNGTWNVMLHRKLLPTPGGKDHPYVDKQVLEVQPLDVTVSFERGTPADLKIINAITDVEVR